MSPNASPTRYVNPALLRKAIAAPLFVGGFFLILGWTAFAAAKLFSFDFLGTDHHITADYAGNLRLTFYLWMAIALTVLAIVGGGWVAYDRARIVRAGRVVPGHITGLATMTYKGMRKVVVEYEVDGKTHQYASSEGQTAVAMNLKLGDPVTVYVHPARPARAVVDWKPAAQG